MGKLERQGKISRKKRRDNNERKTLSIRLGKKEGESENLNSEGKGKKELDERLILQGSPGGHTQLSENLGCSASV